MFGMNVEWDNQQAQGHHHHHRSRQPPQSSGGFFNNLFGGKKEEDKKAGHVYYYTTSSRPSAPRRAETISVLPAGVKMPTGDKPQISYAADGTKYLVIPPRRSNSTRQVVVTSGGSTPKRKDSTASHRATPRRSNSTQVKPTSPPVSSRTPKIVGDPELVKQYENSQRNVARWVESVGDSTSSRTPSRARRTSTR
ncbi:hypothetical protein RSOL_475560 [Rhizoctonia solani AG-3 Rhs1AP]|uniref:Uncharacterized protein n=1 Tax=Rhizoctonia solani AG-3 Rhs1AP TaxID=1086054 RepID=X8JRQ0_9AGAM|nr:hypothetical protein RSOL_475560 [Rhizoctonia solani AG-3 Rhs1AP]